MTKLHLLSALTLSTAVLMTGCASLHNVKESDEQLLAKGVWHDKKTDLLWTRCSIGQTWTGSSCVGAAFRHSWDSAMSIAKESDYAGRKEWRLPTLKELETLMIKDKRGYAAPDGSLFAPLLDIEGMPNQGVYWSSTVDKKWNTVWFVRFGNGTTAYNWKSDTYFVRLVHSGN